MSLFICFNRIGENSVLNSDIEKLQKRDFVMSIKATVYGVHSEQLFRLSSLKTYLNVSLERTLSKNLSQNFDGYLL